MPNIAFSLMFDVYLYFEDIVYQSKRQEKYSNFLPGFYVVGLQPGVKLIPNQLVGRVLQCRNFMKPGRFKKGPTLWGALCLLCRSKGHTSALMRTPEIIQIRFKACNSGNIYYNFLISA